MLQRNQQSDCRSRDSGFTLLELLTVMLIISVLAALSIGAAMRLTGVAYRNNSAATLTKVNSTLKNQWQWVVSDSLNPTRNKGSMSGWDNYGKVYAGSDGQEDKRKQYVFMRLRLRQEFPMNFYEALNPAPLPAEPTYQSALNNAGLDVNSIKYTDKPNKWEAAVCLALALQKSRGGSVLNLDDLGASVKLMPNPSQDPSIKKAFPTLKDNHGLKAIVDGYGEPIGFYRWPTSYAPMNPNGPYPVNAAASEEDRLLSMPGWVSDQKGGVPFKALCHDVQPNKAYRLTPVLVSFGKNRNDKKGDGVQVFPRGTPDPLASDGSGLDQNNLYSFTLDEQ